MIARRRPARAPVPSLPSSARASSRPLRPLRQAILAAGAALLLASASCAALLATSPGPHTDENAGCGPGTEARGGFCYPVGDVKRTVDDGGSS